jgi:pimeloyl-ACP methyl ester carboxylesterase
MQVFESDGVEIAFIDGPPESSDRGEPILLVHGFASNHRVNWVDPRWVTTLSRDGRRVVAFDNRGHGRSQKLYDPAAYATERMAEDARRLLDHLGIERADVMGYSMGARIGAFLAIGRPDRVRSLVLGGLGAHLVDSAGLPLGIAEALEGPAGTVLDNPMQRMFRNFADSTGSDLRALAACIRGSRESLGPDALGRIFCPVLVAVGTKDPIAGDPRGLAALLPDAEVLDIPDRDHNLAVGDKAYKKGVLEFLARRP